MAVKALNNVIWWVKGYLGLATLQVLSATVSAAAAVASKDSYYLVVIALGWINFVVNIVMIIWIIMAGNAGNRLEIQLKKNVSKPVDTLNVDMWKAIFDYCWKFLLVAHGLIGFMFYGGYGNTSNPGVWIAFSASGVSCFMAFLVFWQLSHNVEEPLRAIPKKK